MDNTQNNSLLIGNKELSNELNQRIYKRNMPLNNLDIAYGIRPQATKYMRNPMLTVIEPLSNRKFNSGEKVGGWSGYAANIQKESILKNQINPIQNNSRTTYIPNMNSELYNQTMPTGQSVDQPFPYLFNSASFSNNSKDSANFSNKLFNNHTRQQIKEEE